MEDVSFENAECYKVIILGESGVGRSSLLLRFLEDKFTTTDETLYQHPSKKMVMVNEKKVILQVWDAERLMVSCISWNKW